MVVGLGVGGGAVFFRWLLDKATHFFFGAGLRPDGGMELFGTPAAPRWLLPLVPMVGGLLVGPIIHFVAKEAKGHGVPEVMQAVALRGGRIRRRVAVAKAIASALCIGSGGSAGREGPIVQIGAAMGSSVGQATRVSSERMKTYVACGAASGIAAIFRAPVAGVLFSLEVILGDLALASLTPVLISAVMASIVASAAFGNRAVFDVPAYYLASVREIPLYAFLGVATGVASAVFILFLYWTEDRFDELRIPGYLKPGLGGLLLGILAFFLPQELADGYPTINAALHGEEVFWLLGILAAGKLLATVFTLGSGNSGGIFAPSLFLGATLGGALGGAYNAIWPGVCAPSGAYATVGMAAVVAGATRAPITSVLIVFEMTNDYRIILPLMLTVAISTLVSSRLSKESIYTLKLARRGIHLHRGREMRLMEETPVYTVMKPATKTIPCGTPLTEVMRIMSKARQHIFPVVDESGCLYGILTRSDLADLAGGDIEYVAAVTLAQDVAVMNPMTVYPDDNLNDAMVQLGKRDLKVLPVVEPVTDRLMGMLDRSDIMAAYNRMLFQERRLRAGEEERTPAKGKRPVEAGKSE